MLRNVHRHWRRVRLRPALACSSVPLCQAQLDAQRRQWTSESGATNATVDNDPSTSSAETFTSNSSRSTHSAPTKSRIARTEIDGDAHPYLRPSDARPPADEQRTRYAELRQALLLEATADQALLEEQCSRKRPNSRKVQNKSDGVQKKRPSAQSLQNLLYHVVERREDEDWLSWVGKAAASRKHQMPVVVMQLMLREGMLPLDGSSAALDDLPDSVTWENTLAQLRNKGHTIEQLQSYAHILSAESNVERIQRFLEKDEFKPIVLFNFLLRCNVDHADLLESLIKYCRRWYTTWRDGPRSWQTSIPLTAIDMKDRHHPLALLIKRCYHLEPRLLPNVAEAVAVALRAMSQATHASHNDAQLQQSRVYNQALCLFRQSLYGVQSLRKLPSAYTWASLEILLNTSASLEKPCLTSLGGFRAIKEAMASQSRDQKDLRIIPRLSTSWPPYLLPSDGMDELAEPDENWSRTVLASAFMQENGYAKEEADLALDILQGMAPNGIPTVQQNETLVKVSGMHLWEASILATRDTVEAWRVFQSCPGNPKAPLTVREYTAMFRKLGFRDVRPSDKALPGDRDLNFSSSSNKNLTEVERLRLQPPTVEELYKKMRKDGIAPDTMCLRVLIRQAHSVQEVSAYIHDSDLPAHVKKALLKWEAWDAGIFSDDRDFKVDLQFFSDFAMAWIRIQKPSSHRVRAMMERAVEALRAARADSVQQRHMAAFWSYALGQLAYRGSRRRQAAADQLAAILHTARLIEEAGQTSSATLVQFAKTLRKFIAHQFGTAGADYSPQRDAAYGIHVPISHRSKDWLTAACDTIPANALKIDMAVLRGLSDGLELALSALRRHISILIRQDQHARSLLADETVPPIEQMVNRQDPVQGDQVLELISAFAYLGAFEDAAELLQWAVTQWMAPDVVDALWFLDDDANFYITFCVFRKLVEPRVSRETMDGLKAVITSGGSPFRWPGADEVKATFKLS